MSDLLEFEVIGSLPVVDAVTRNEVRTGGTVRLDPARTLIDPLIEGGSIKALPAKAKPKE